MKSNIEIKKKRILQGIIIIILCLISSCELKDNCSDAEKKQVKQPINSNQSSTKDYFLRLSDSALSLTQNKVTYNPSYFTINYPNGDVPADKGVCSDVVIRAYRKLGVDLQKEVHEDMKQNFSQYPNIWGLQGTDKNIDHRRVPNLMTFFERKKASLPITQNAKNYKYGEIVCWKLEGGLTHIGIVVHLKSADFQRNLIVHNIGNGQVVEDALFAFKIIGHYRFKPN